MHFLALAYLSVFLQCVLWEGTRASTNISCCLLPLPIFLFLSNCVLWEGITAPPNASYCLQSFVFFCLFFCHVLWEGINKLYWMHLLGFSLCLFVCLFAMCCERVKEKSLVVGRFSQLLRHGGWNTKQLFFWQAPTFRSKRRASKTPSWNISVLWNSHACSWKTFPTHCLQNASVSGRRTWQYNQCWVGPHVLLLSSCKNCTQDEATGADWRVSNALEGFSYSNISRETGCHKGGRWTVEDRGREKIERR